MRLLGTVFLASACVHLLFARDVEVCMVGYVMDTFCIRRGTLLDNPSLSTLENPMEHTLHCLVDVSSCITRGYEVLRDPAGKYEASNTHCRAFQLDDVGDSMALQLARSTGQRGRCTTCSGGSDGLVRGFRATVLGTYDDGEGPIRTLKTRQVLPASVGCNGTETVIDDSNCTAEAGGDQNLVLAHGSMMLVGWGALIPSGVILAHFLRHLDPLWFKLHRAVQTVGLVFTLVGFTIAVTQFNVFEANYHPPAQIHGSLGICVMIVGLLQPLNAFFRPHKQKDHPITFKRRCWELYHKGAGYFAIILAAATIVLGTVVAGGRTGQGFQIAYGVIVAGLGLLSVALVFARRRALSTVEIQCP